MLHSGPGGGCLERPLSARKSCMYEVVAGAKGRRLSGFSLSACHSTDGIASQGYAAGHLAQSGMFRRVQPHTRGCSLTLSAECCRFIKGEFCTLMLPYVVL